MNMKEQLAIQAMYSGGAFEAPATSDIPDRDDIAAMPKGEVREWLEAHGADIPQGATVSEMREMLTKIMFVSA